MGRLDGKVAIVTGTGPGIGRAIPTIFAREGARVVLVDVRPEFGEETVQQIRAAGGQAEFLQADAAKSADWKRIVDLTLATYGKITTLVNSASWAKVLPGIEIDEEDWDHTMAGGLKSAWLGAKFCIPHMIEAGGGAIVNISSANGLVSNPGFTAYSSAKSGMLGLTRGLAIDYGLQGIRVNAICPGLIVNDVTSKRFLSDPDEDRGSRDPYLVGRYGKPEDIAYAALYLASDEAAFVTATTLSVDGGLTAQSPEAVIRPSFRRRWRKDTVVFRDPE